MRAVLTLSVFWLTTTAALGAAEPFAFFQPVTPPRAFQVMVHRGHGQLAPENTRKALELCIEDGLEWAEVDVRLTKDGQHVLFHDARLDGKSNGSGLVKDHTLAELKKLDAGSWFAKRFANAKLLSLEECFALVKGKLNLYLDCKDVDPELLVRQIKAAGVENQVIVFDKPAVLKRVRELSGGTVAVMPKWHTSDGFGKWLDELQPAAVEIDTDEITPEVCREFHDRGIRVEAKVLGQWDQPKFWEQVLAAGVDYLQTDKPEEILAHALHKQVDPLPVRITCHRGASRYAPENSLAAFDKAYRLHADFVEFDVRPSSDGKFFLLHDSKLDRTTNAQGPINQASSQTVESLDAGSWFGKPFAGTHIPTLDEFLSAVPEGVTLYFDAKDIPPEALAAALEKHHLAERTVVYKDARYLERLKQIDPRIRALPPASSIEQVSELAAGLKPYGVDTPWNKLNKAYIEHCHAAGIQVFADAPFFVDLKGFRQAIDWGIDVIQTDHPLRVYRAIELTAADRARQ